jgi:hypothetical protein
MQKQTILAIVITSLVVIVSLLVVFLQHYPVFTMQILILTLVCIGWVLTEFWQTHDTIESENRFWCTIGFLIARACVFDSPFSFPVERNFLAWTFVFVFTYAVHLIERDIQRKRLSRPIGLPKLYSALFTQEVKSQAMEKLGELIRLREMLDNKYISSTFMNFFNLGTVLQVEAQILEILKETSKDELCLIITDPSFKLPVFFQKMKDHFYFRSEVQINNRSALVDLLAIQRRSDLDLRSKICILDAFQQVKTTAFQNSDDYVWGIIQQTKGDELSRLKTLVDGKGNVENFYNLIYKDIKSNDIRKKILEYIQTQKNVQESQLGPLGKRRAKLAWRKILADIDDTIVCSGNSWPAGMDTRFPKHVYYPGVFAFIRELDFGSNPESAQERSDNLALTSARPHVGHDGNDLSEDKIYSKFNDLKTEGRIDTVPTVLPGDLTSGAEFMAKEIQGEKEKFKSLAEKKFGNIKGYMCDLYPEYKFVFIGDNGQGDLRAIELIANDSRLKKNFTRGYIHVVQPLVNAYSVLNTNYPNPTAGTSESMYPNICFFTNYIEAALDAYDPPDTSPKMSKVKTKPKSLIKLSGVLNVVKAAVADLKRIESSTTDIAKIKLLNTRAGELNASILRANKVYVEHWVEESVKDNKLECEPNLLKYYMNRFPNGSVVQISMGKKKSCSCIKGVVVGFRRTDCLYQVLVQWDSTGLKPPVRFFLQGSAMELDYSQDKDALKKTPEPGWFKSGKPIILRSTCTQSRLGEDEVAKQEVPSIASSPSNKSQSTTHGSLSTPQLRVQDIARHNARNRVYSARPDAKDIPLPTIVQELVFVPSLAERAAYHATSTFSSAASVAVGTRARTISSASDEIKSGEMLSGHKKDPDDILRKSRGALCWTPFGVGFVKDYNKFTDIITVSFAWGAEGFFIRFDVVQLTNPAETLQRVSTPVRDESPVEAPILIDPSVSKSLIHGVLKDIPPDLKL